LLPVAPVRKLICCYRAPVDNLSGHLRIGWSNTSRTDCARDDPGSLSVDHRGSRTTDSPESLKLLRTASRGSGDAILTQDRKPSLPERLTGSILSRVSLILFCLLPFVLSFHVLPLSNLVLLLNLESLFLGCLLGLPLFLTCGFLFTSQL
jgi:hypothetical protein